MRVVYELQNQIRDLTEQIKELEKFREETKEMYEGIKSILKVFSMIEKFCIWLVKVSAAVAAMYAGWRFIGKQLAENLKSAL